MSRGRRAYIVTKVKMRQQDRLQTVREALPRWFRRNRRDLPWRGRRDPYAIWISEVMLQQTRVETVKPYYRRFLRAFPTSRALAGASLGSVLKAWEGLGYYSRAQNLHRAAKQIVSDLGGKLPGTMEGLRRLPGIGRSTAGAIASIAFGLDEPVLDGNVTRVLCRVFGIRQLPSQPKTQSRLWSLARRLIPPGGAGLFNQALMDLGATVCVPRKPRCRVCPIRKACRAFASSEQDKLPRKAKPRPLPHRDIVAGVVRRRGRILIDRRPPEGLLGGLWEFPGGKVEPREPLRAALRREVREELGIDIRVEGPLLTVRHAYTHFRITLHVFECTWAAGAPRALGCAEFKWVRPGELTRYAFPAANHKIIAALRERAAAPGKTRRPARKR